MKKVIKLLLLLPLFVQAKELSQVQLEQRLSNAKRLLLIEQMRQQNLIALRNFYLKMAQAKDAEIKRLRRQLEETQAQTRKLSVLEEQFLLQ